MTRALRGLAVFAALVPAVALADQPAAPVAAPAAGPSLPALTLPAGWTPLSALADAARAATIDEAGARPITVEAWGDTVRGCFATAIAIGLRSADAPALATELRTALATSIAIDDWREGNGVVSARLAKPGWHGTLRGLVSARTELRATVFACFYNDRAPARCEAACTSLLAELPASFAAPAAPPAPAVPPATGSPRP